MQSEPLQVNMQRAAVMLGVSLRTVQDLIATGHLPSRRAGRHRLIPYEDLLRFVRLRTQLGLSFLMHVKCRVCGKLFENDKPGRYCAVLHITCFHPHERLPRKLEFRILQEQEDRWRESQH